MSVIDLAFTDYLGCYNDAVLNRTLSFKFGNGYSVISCLSDASAAGYRYAGLEYGGECWADSELRK